MGRSVAVREGSSSSELPLSPPSPKPSPQAPLLLRPPIQPRPKPRFRSPGLTSPHLIPGGSLVLVAGVPSAVPAPCQGCSFRGQTGSEMGLLLRRAAGSGQTPRTLGSGRRLADAARPPGGARGRLGGQPRPAPVPNRPGPGVAPPPARRRSGARIDAGTYRARLQLGRGGPDRTRSRRESPLERGSAPSGDCRCVAGARGRGGHAWGPEAETELPADRRGAVRPKSVSCSGWPGQSLLSSGSVNRVHCWGRDPHTSVPSNPGDRRAFRRLSILI